MVFSELANALAPFVGLVVGAIISATAVLIATAISNRAQDKRLRIQLRIQLLSDEAKEALTELYRLINTPEKGWGAWASNIRKFLNGYEGRAFLPTEVRAWAREKLRNFSDRYDEMYPDEAALEQMQAEQDEESRQDWIDSLSDEQRTDYEFDELWKQVKREFRSYLIEAIPMLVNPKSPGIRDRIKRSLKGKTPFF
jgi:gas vesicle protein